MATTLATLGGLKIQDSIEYQGQVRKYAGIKKKFADAMTEAMPGWYLPKWQNEKIWERQRNNYIKNGHDNKKLTETFPTAFSFRDYCYGKAEKTNFDECNASNGWCMECGRDSQDEKNLTEEERL